MVDGKPDDLILLELRKMSKLLAVANAPALETELTKIAINDSRKKMWVLIDGERMPKDLAEEVGVSVKTVSIFVNALLAAGFIEYKKGQPPRRILDYVPASWLNLVEPEKVEDEQEGPVEPSQEHEEAKKETG